MAKRYWLVKSEPEAYSIDDLRREKVACWDGVRNYRARNYMRDEMRAGDEVLFYHSNAKPPGVAGIARVCREHYPDHTSWDKSDPHYDPKSTPHEPRWFMVDLEFVEKFERLIPLDEMRSTAALRGMPLLARGQRLSVQPVSAEHFQVIKKLAKRSRG